MKRKWGRWRRWRRWGRSEGIGRLQKVKGKEGLREVPTSMETNGGGEWWGVVGRVEEVVVVVGAEELVVMVEAVVEVAVNHRFLNLR